MQAILPLRGKILNIERRDEAAMYKNEEIQNLILGLGLGVKVKIIHVSSVLELYALNLLTSSSIILLKMCFVGSGRGF